MMWHAKSTTKPENVRVRLLGVADSAFSVPGVILSSFTGG